LTDNIKLTDPENPVVGARIWGVSPAEALIADFLLKIANFGCHGNNGLLEPNVTGTVELADFENHTIEPKITTLSYIHRSYGNFLVKFPISRYYGNRGRLSKV